MNWYYANQGQRQGPVSESELAQLESAGTLVADTLVWREGMANWSKWSEVKPAAPTAPVAAMAAAPAGGPDDTEICAFSGQRYPRREMLQFEGKWIAAEHRDTYFQRVREGVGGVLGGAVPGPFGYASVGRRFCAVFCDSVILGAFNMLTNFLVVALGGAEGSGRWFALQAGMTMLNFGVGLIYCGFFLSRYGATPGKMLFGIKVVRADGSPLSFGRGTGRYAATLISSMTLMIGYIMALFDEQRRALHDRICDTRVIKTRK